MEKKRIFKKRTEENRKGGEYRKLEGAGEYPVDISSLQDLTFHGAYFLLVDQFGIVNVEATTSVVSTWREPWKAHARARTASQDK